MITEKYKYFFSNIIFSLCEGCYNYEKDCYDCNDFKYYGFIESNFYLELIYIDDLYKKFCLIFKENGVII